MIKHIVCFKLKDNSDSKKNEAAEIFRSMRGKVPQIKDLAVGIDFLGSARSYDIIIEVTLEDEKALEDYQKDPYHCDVVKKYIHAAQESSISVDYKM